MIVAVIPAQMLSLSTFCEVYFCREDGPYRTCLKEYIAKGNADSATKLAIDDQYKAHAIAFLRKEDTPERRAAVKNEYKPMTPCILRAADAASDATATAATTTTSDANADATTDATTAATADTDTIADDANSAAATTETATDAQMSLSLAAWLDIANGNRSAYTIHHSELAIYDQYMADAIAFIRREDTAKRRAAVVNELMYYLSSKAPP